MTDSRTLQEAVADMRHHFQATGSYRARDLLRVVGNPVGGVIALASAARQSGDVQQAPAESPQSGLKGNAHD